MRASAAAEKAGFRTVSLVGKGFVGQARLIGQLLGLRNMAIAEYPAVIMNEDDETFRRTVTEVLVDRVFEGFATAPTQIVKASADPDPRDAVFRGSLEEVQEHFYKNGWTDGLPIMPPTLESVERFLRFTDRSPDEVITTLLPERRQATVWNVAVNGVMAGCRPEYMPLLLAIVEAIGDPAYAIEDAGSTPGWESLVIVNGPIVKELGFNYLQGVMRVGRQANSSVGRFLRMYIRNIAGIRIPAEGETSGTDKGSIAFTFNVALAENEDAVRELGWTTLGVERGFAPDDSVVTVQSVVTVSQPIYAAGSRAIEIAERIADMWGNADCARRAYTGMEYDWYRPLLVMTPAIAKVFAADGWDKDAIKRYLYENVKITARRAQADARHSGATELDVYQRSKLGRIPAAYGESDDLDRQVPVFMHPDWIDIVVAGDPDRNQVRGYVQNHRQGWPVSRKVRR